MKVTVFIKNSQGKDLQIKNGQSFHDLYIKLGGIGYPKMIQIGGALGLLLRGKEVHNSIYDYQDEFLEPFISYFDDFCPVDYMRFLTRFLIRNLNIINDNIHEIYRIISKVIDRQGKSYDLDALKDLIIKKPDSLGEKLLYLRLDSLLNWYEDDFMSHIQGKCSHGICRGLFDAKCINACPAHIHIPGFVALMKQKRYQEAHALMRKENPFNSVCGYVCARPCESACRRKEITDTIGVRALQRFISSESLKEPFNESCLEDRGKSIGIIGGGPSGLTAAYYLRRTGYSVTIYEKENHLGGMLAFGVPEYRLPLRVLEKEIQTILNLGIEVKLNTCIGQDIIHNDLKDSHDALIVSTGRPLGKKMKLDHPNVHTAIDFLRDVRKNMTFKPMKNILVIGGGDVAMDCSRTARRLGAQVTLVSLEKYDSMPASMEEIIQAQEEGVNLLSGYGINHIQGTEVCLSKCLEVWDCEGNFNPIMEDSDKVLNPIDTIILAIGQEKDLSFLGNSKDTNEDIPLYYCGDLTSPTIVIDAIAKGKKSALDLHKKFGGSQLYTGPCVDIPEDILSILSFDYDQALVKSLAKEKRILSFEPVNQNYTFQEALYEANRCMRCDQNSKAPLLLGRRNI